jgi:asparagine synthase (glutamine-hydrolysing)
MCGINGLMNYSHNPNSVDPIEVTKVRDAMTLRGPDSFGYWSNDNGKVAFGHRRLAIVDLSITGHQPMTNADGSLTIVFNGEIYNHNELRNKLQSKGFVFQSSSDTEVVLALYSYYGLGMLDKLRGMFAFAIWDGCKRKLFLARDPIGIKPLYISCDQKSFRFASQVKALIKSNDCDMTPEPAGHIGFFTWGHVPEPFTLYKGVRALKPGSCLVVDESGEQLHKTYFSFSSHYKECKDHIISKKITSKDHCFANDLIESVDLHTLADVDVGVFLSGGRDSITLAGIASSLKKYNGSRKLKTITLGFEEFIGTPNDEVPDATRVAEQIFSEHIVKMIKQEDFRSNYDKFISSMDQPTIDGINTYFVSKAAKEENLKVAISGLGADEFFGGYPSFVNIPKIVKIFKFLRYFPRLRKAIRKFVANVPYFKNKQKIAAIFEYGFSYEGAYFLNRGLFMPWELTGLFDNDFISQGLKDLSTMSLLSKSISEMDTPKLKILSLEAQWYMRNQLLRDSDWAGMAHSIEIRTPFVDKKILSSTFYAEALGKPISKKNMADTNPFQVPSEILNKKKTGFSTPINLWLTDLLGSKNNKKLVSKDLARHIYKKYLESI